MSKVAIILLPPECDVCGQEAHPKFLQEFNGITACTYCIREINEEAEHYHANHIIHPSARTGWRDQQLGFGSRDYGAGVESSIADDR
jgi:hypothetical protein